MITGAMLNARKMLIVDGSPAQSEELVALLTLSLLESLKDSVILKNVRLLRNATRILRLALMMVSAKT
jgi:hypothetical protein